MQRRNACARQVPSSVEMFLNVQPVPSISPAAALSPLTLPSGTKNMSSAHRPNGMAVFFISGIRRPSGCLLLSEQAAMSGSVTASMM